MPIENSQQKPGQKPNFGPWMVCVNGKTMPWKHEIDNQYGPQFSNLELSADAKHVAYVIIKRSGNQQLQYVVLDGQASMEYPKINNGLFSPDGKRYVYMVTTGSSKRDIYVVEGDHEFGPYQEVENLQFTPDGKLIYAMRDKQGRSVVLDGQRGEIHNGIISELYFDPNSNQIAYTVLSSGKHDQKCYIIGRELPERGRTSKIAFSNNPSRLAYVQSTGKPNKSVDKIVIVDKNIEQFDTTNVDQQTLAFTPDGKYLLNLKTATYNATPGVIIQGRDAVQFQGIGRYVDKQFRFTKDNHAWLYATNKQNDYFRVTFSPQKLIKYADKLKIAQSKAGIQPILLA